MAHRGVRDGGSPHLYAFGVVIRGKRGWTARWWSPIVFLYGCRTGTIDCIGHTVYDVNNSF